MIAKPTRPLAVFAPMAPFVLAPFVLAPFVLAPFVLALFVLALCACAPASGGGSSSADAAPPTDGSPTASDTMPADAMPPDAIPDTIPSDTMLADAIPSDAMPPEPSGTAGCGRAPVDGAGGVQIEEMFEPSAGGRRSYFLALPADYDPQRRHRLIIGYAGTDWSGEMIRPYLNLERDGRDDEIVVYPDLLSRDFEGWGRLGGWLLGPHARPADGMDDIEFTRQLVDRLGERYCVDPDRIFATGHSWGGDMAAVVGCFLGDRLRAVAPAAANRPYWFEPADGPVGCMGEAAVWTFFGEADGHFASQDYPGEYGDEQVAFWRARHGCGDGTEPLPYDAAGACVRYAGCAADTRYCLYGPETGHQIPPYFSEAVLGWFRSF